MSVSKFKLIAGLGNPGRDYAQTRHNIGFLVIDALASVAGLDINKTLFDAAYTRGKIQDWEVFLVKPMSYMNRSGIPLQKFASYYKIEMPDILVVHDDLDLEFGQIKIVQSRGHGGHNGVRSIVEAFGNNQCVRVRVGVGHPGAQKGVVGHVLGSFTPDEQKALDLLVKAAADACLSIVKQGVTQAMNSVNVRR